MEELRQHTDYGQVALDETDLLANPFEQLRVWIKEATDAELYEPNAMVLATVDAQGHPTNRTVLLRGVDARGLFFVTNFESRKGRAIDDTGRVSAVLGWYKLHRQVLIDGVAEPVDPAESDAYFAERPRGSQLSAWVSQQSQPIDSRATLEERYRQLETEYEGREVPRPPFWGGYRIVPMRIEFWAGRTSRLHDRVEFSRAGIAADWNVQRLQP